MVLDKSDTGYQHGERWRGQARRQKRNIKPVFPFTVLTAPYFQTSHSALRHAVRTCRLIRLRPLLKGHRWITRPIHSETSN